MNGGNAFVGTQVGNAIASGNSSIWYGYDFELKNDVVVDNYDIIKQ